MFTIFRKELWTKELVAWYLYDFANSFVYINATAYFSQWIVVDRGLTDLWFSLPFIIATIILVFFSTFVGRIGDLKGNHAKFFAGFTFIAIAAMTALFLSGRFIPGMPGVVLALIFFGIYQFGYQLALVPYTAFIKYISREEIYGKVSGIGFTSGQLGNILGLLATLPIINHQVTFFGTDRLSTLVPSILLFLVFFLPSFFIFRKKYFPPTLETEKPQRVWRAFVDNLKKSRKHPGVFRLLLSYYLFSDAINTLSLFAAIYLQKVFGIGDVAKASIILIILVGVGIGSFLGGTLADRFGHRKILVFSLLVETLTVGTIALNKSPELLSTIFFIFGLAMGIIYATSRSYLASLIPKNESGTYFGLYTFAERFASVIGPLVWSFVIIVASSLAPANYRIAAFVMAVFVLCATIPFLRKKPLFVEA